MKKAICCFFVGFFIIQGLLFFRQPEKVLTYENRAIREFPAQIRWTARGVKNFFSEVDGYFNDRLIGRETMVALYGRLGARLGDIGSYDLALKGRDDWLFLGNNFGHGLDKLRGRAPLKVRRSSAERAQSIAAAAQELAGPEVVVLIGPNKSSVYPEYLPGFLKPAARRYVEDYADQLRGRGLTVLDPTEALKAAKPERLLYYRSDTHWNLAGAAVAFNQLLSHLNSLPRLSPLAAPLAIPDYTLAPLAPFHGDLIVTGNFRGYNVRPGDTFGLAWARPAGELIQVDEQGRRSPLSATAGVPPFEPGRTVTVYNPQAAAKLKVWLYRDSFSDALSPFFHAVFAETVHIDERVFGKFKPAGAEPDLVVFELVERNF